MTRLPLLGLALLLCAALLAAPVAAVENIEYTDARILNVEAPEDGVISSIICADIPAGGDISLNLNAYGEMYLLTIDESGSWGWWDFNVTCVYPNGTAVSKSLSTLRPFAQDYDLTLQPYWISSVNSMYFDVDVNVGLIPLTATFQDAYNPTTVQDLAFSQVSGSFSQPTDVTVFIASAKEWETQASDDPTGALSEALSDFFSWTWDQILVWVGKIPVIGPLFIETIDIVGTTITETYFWISLYFQYWPLLVLLLEFWFISDAMMSTHSLLGLLKRLIKNHVKFFEGLLKFIEISANLIKGIVNAISAIVNALKPI